MAKCVRRHPWSSCVVLQNVRGQSFFLRMRGLLVLRLRTDCSSSFASKNENVLYCGVDEDKVMYSAGVVLHPSLFTRVLLALL